MSRYARSKKSTSNVDTQQKGFQEDPRLFKLKRGDKKEVKMKIRLIPVLHETTPEEHSKFFKLTYHNNYRKTSSFITLCHGTYNEPCVACDLQKTVSFADMKNEKIGMNEKYLVNFLMLENSQNPETEGKTFVTVLPKSIAKLVVNACDDEDEDEIKDAFDPENGYDLILILDDTGMKCWERSKLSNKSTPLADTDEGIDGLLDGAYDLETISKEVFTIREDAKLATAFADFLDSIDIDYDIKTLKNIQKSSGMSNKEKAEREAMVEKSPEELKGSRQARKRRS